MVERAAVVSGAVLRHPGEMPPRRRLKRSTMPPAFARAGCWSAAGRVG
jgi:hypothetical protein